MFLDYAGCMTEYSSLSEKTKGGIVECIMGLGIHLCKGYEELKDIPGIINEIEKGLRNVDFENIKKAQ
eukprot:2728616-Heterocapsa_arctica.AAC.1